MCKVHIFNMNAFPVCPYVIPLILTDYFMRVGQLYHFQVLKNNSIVRGKKNLTNIYIRVGVLKDTSAHGLIKNSNVAVKVGRSLI